MGLRKPIAMVADVSNEKIFRRRLTAPFTSTSQWIKPVVIDLQRTDPLEAIFIIVICAQFAIYLAKYFVIFFMENKHNDLVATMSKHTLLCFYRTNIGPTNRLTNLVVVVWLISKNANDVNIIIFLRCHL